MRVTNGMIRNNSLNALYNNMGKLDKLYNQMSTLKKIQRPSDDPIIAGRSLKLKINVLESEQYKSNTEEATSWMSVTETALSNITGIIKDIRTKCVQASTDTLGTDDREKIKTDIEQLWQQLQQESNVTYTGRYVFSGYKTNEPVMLVKETNNLTEPTHLYDDMTLLKGTVIPTNILAGDGSVLVAAGTLDTEVNVPPTTTRPVGGALTGNAVLAEKLTLTADMILGGDVTLPNGTQLSAGDTVLAGTTFPAGTILKVGFTPPTDIEVRTVLPTGTVLPKGTVNPKVLGKINEQNIQYEVGVGSTIDVNTLGMDKLMSQFFADIKEIKDALDSHADGDPLTDKDLHALFSKKIGDFDKRLSTSSEMTADLGSKMNRLEYTATRLTDDKTNFTELLSKTEDVDLEEIYTEFNAQYAVYQSALQATSKVIMNTLADFLR